MPNRKNTMTRDGKAIGRRPLMALAAALLAIVAPLAPAVAQVTTVDPDAAIDSDLNQGSSYNSGTTYNQGATYPSETQTYNGTSSQGNGTPITDWNGQPVPATPNAPQPYSTTSAVGVQNNSTTYREDDLIGAAEGVFGKGAKGLADVIRDLLGKQGEPNGYIVGREAGGAIAIGLRYGSGTLHHKVEGTRPVYWTGPSIGFDAGANAGSAFVLVYNLYDSQELFHRFGAGEGQAYLVGGFTISYLRRGNTVLIPVRAGAGLRLGANIGYMKFSEKQRWLPF